MFPNRDKRCERKARLSKRLPDRNRISDRKARTDYNKIGEIRKRTRFFES